MRRPGQNGTRDQRIRTEIRECGRKIGRAIGRKRVQKGKMCETTVKEWTMYRKPDEDVWETHMEDTRKRKVASVS